MTACDIIWYVSDEDVLAVLYEMTDAHAAEALCLPIGTYANMTTEERHAYAVALSRFERQGIMNLPECVDVPDGMTDYDDIDEWLEDEYSFCHHGFTLR